MSEGGAERVLKCGGCGEEFEPENALDHFVHLGMTPEAVDRIRNHREAETVQELMRRIQVDPEGTSEPYHGPDPRETS